MSDIQEEQKRLYKRVEENDIKLLREENKKLKDLCNKYEEEHNTTFIEWQKDINIIDELEKYLKKQMEYYKLDTDYYVEYKLTLDKLNELKGDNK